MSILDPSKISLLAGPILILLVLSMMILPLPPFALDLFFTFNIALSIMVLMVSMFTKKPLEFAAFPSVLLFATLLRLSLNVASTRTVLMNGHTGGDSAGQVIEAFGQFLVGGNFAVGLAVFLIIIIINFMVVTKGAGRIAEVGARFMLDAMPGKQMAIDADLNAGLIGEDEARTRRATVSQEADFFGSMDGASKFVRGDAIAGLIIMFVNILGGLMIGMLQHDMSFGAASESYILLTIGDGLVAQIPALVISIAAGVMVSKVDTAEDVGHQMISQLFTNPNVLFFTAIVMGTLGLVPGMPHLVFIIFAILPGALGWHLMKRNERSAVLEEQVKNEQAVTEKKAPDVSWDDVTLIDTLSLEVGHRLIPLVSTDEGELLNRIKGVRKKFAQDVGFLPPVVRIKDNLNIEPNEYFISLKGAVIGEGEVYPDKWLAINPGQVTGELDGIASQDPAFGLPAVWISANQREHAQIYGYTVVDAPTVIATHLNHLMQNHSAEMMGRHEVQQLIEKLGGDYKSLVDEVVPSILSLTQLQRLLQRLLEEQVPIRDMRTILDGAAEFANQTVDMDELLARVRVSLGRVITQQHFSASGELAVIGLAPQLETVLRQAMGNGGALEPGLGQAILTQAEEAVQKQEDDGLPAVFVVPHDLRVLMSHFLRRAMRDLAVISQLEVPEDRLLRFTRLVGTGR
jgi:flagellar biosynthesis protein FlhA